VLGVALIPNDEIDLWQSFQCWSRGAQDFMRFGLRYSDRAVSCVCQHEHVGNFLRKGPIY
jgi:hypothetical protein